MKKVSRSLISLCLATGLAVFAVSCGSDSSPAAPVATTLNSAQSGVVMSAVSTAVSSAVSQQGMEAMNAEREEDALPGTPPHKTAVGPLTVNCSAGGTASVSGTITIATSGTNPVTVTANPIAFTITMTNCQGKGSDGNSYTLNSTGLTIAGSLDMTITSSGSGQSETVTVAGTDSTTISGDVNVTGAVSMDCTFNVDESVTINTASTPAYSGTYSGTVCGTTVNATFSD